VRHEPSLAECSRLDARLGEPGKEERGTRRGIRTCCGSLECASRRADELELVRVEAQLVLEEGMQLVEVRPHIAARLARDFDERFGGGEHEASPVLGGHLVQVRHHRFDRMRRSETSSVGERPPRRLEHGFVRDDVARKNPVPWQKLQRSVAPLDQHDERPGDLAFVMTLRRASVPMVTIEDEEPDTCEILLHRTDDGRVLDSPEKVAGPIHPGGNDGRDRAVKCEQAAVETEKLLEMVVDAVVGDVVTRHDRRKVHPGRVGKRDALVDSVRERPFVKGDLSVTDPVEVEDADEAEKEVLGPSTVGFDRLQDVDRRLVADAVYVERRGCVLDVRPEPECLAQATDGRKKKPLEGHSVGPGHEACCVEPPRTEPRFVLGGERVVDGADHRVRVHGGRVRMPSSDGEQFDQRRTTRRSDAAAV